MKFIRKIKCVLGLHDWISPATWFSENPRDPEDDPIQFPSGGYKWCRYCNAEKISKK